MAQNVHLEPRKTPVQARSRDTVEVLLEATARILVEDGYARLTTNRVARRAGVSIGSLYQYFPNKEALVRTLVDRHMERMRDIVLRTTGELMDVPLCSAVAGVVRALIDAHAADPELDKALNEQIPRVGDLGRALEFERGLQQLVRRWLEVHQGEIRPTNLELAAFVLVSAVQGLMYGAVLQGPERILDAALPDEIARLVIAYLEPRE